MNDQLRSDLIAYKMRAAKDLLPEIKSHIDNGFYNTAMNRMYYACFNAATALLIAESTRSEETFHCEKLIQSPICENGAF